MLDRIMKSNFINSKKNIVVCTTKEKVDDALEKKVKKYGASIFRGSKNDLIKRFHDANKIFNFNRILLIDGDDPLIFPEHLDKVMKAQKNSKYQCVYTSDLPFGLNVKSISSYALKKVYNNYLSTKNDTGFGLYFTNSKILKSKKINNFKFNNLLSKARLTLDYIEDFQLIKKIITDIYSKKKCDYSFKKFEKYIIKNFHLLNINMFRQVENLQRSKLKVNLKYKNKYKTLKIIY